MELSLREQILKRFRTNFLKGKDGYVNGGSIEKFAMELGYKSSNASRRCRELENEGLLERKEMKLENSRIASVYYKYIPSEHEKLSLTMKSKIGVSHDEHLLISKKYEKTI